MKAFPTHNHRDYCNPQQKGKSAGTAMGTGGACPVSLDSLGEVGVKGGGGACVSPGASRSFPVAS